MYPEKYEHEYRQEPMPRVKPKPQPLPIVQTQYQEQKFRSPRQPGRFAAIFGRLLNFLFSAGVCSFIWFGFIKELGSITSIPEFDLFLWVMGILYFFWGDILTDNNRRWTERYCGLHRIFKDK